MTTAPHLVAQQRPSPFRGLDVCREAGFQLPANAHRPIFEHDRWDFTDVVGLPVDMPLANRRFDFAAITNLRWRQVAKELMLAMLVPRHPAVALLPRAYRTPLHLRSCAGRLDEIVKLFGWLGQRGITSLAQIDTHVSESYLAFRRYVIDESGQVVGEQSHAIRRAAAQVILDLVDYRELLTADRVRADLRRLGRPAIVARHTRSLASVHDLRILRIRRSHPVFLDAHRMPIVKRDAAVIRPALHARAA